MLNISKFLGVKIRNPSLSQSLAPFPSKFLSLLGDRNLCRDNQYVAGTALVVTEIDSHQQVLIFPPRGIIISPRLHFGTPLGTLRLHAPEGATEWRITPNLRPRMSRVSTLRLKLPSKKSCLSRTRLSRRNSTPRGERGDSGRNGLRTALPAQRIRRPFLPPCQLPPQRLTASPRSAIKPTRNAVRRSICFRSRLSGGCSGRPVRPRSGTSETAPRQYRFRSVRASRATRNSQCR